ncbi:DUF6597 domain-containing transcriptional factor [Roseivirga sp.]|uniref:DUF6597 domain-containing transcriptional factor n=1 Tax=Roseivirga sp. TaxID=1964215 RepID=UPI003B8BDF64
MIYKHIAPSQKVQDYIESYWIVDSEGDCEINREKIIPDGYPEIIFHYEDSFSINIEGKWHEQNSRLLAGQIKNHFFLENSGKSGMIGIKFKPTALFKLFNIDMSSITDQVVPLLDFLPEFSSIDINSFSDKDAFINEIETLVEEKIKKMKVITSQIDLVIHEIQQAQGNIRISTLAKNAKLSERSLERKFLRHIGLSPKLYARIIRLGQVFKLMQENDQSWCDLVYKSGFYDQSHFIKNFKEFTGEDPTSYGFHQETMANFHLNK